MRILLLVLVLCVEVVWVDIVYGNETITVERTISIRKEPSLYADTAWNTNAGEKLKLLNEQNGAWIKVKNFYGQVGWMFESETNETDPNLIKNIETEPVPHKFNSPHQAGKARAQIRAIINPKTYTQNELMKLAVELSNKYKSRSMGSVLVQFFSDASCLNSWDGKGLLRKSDWPYWMCRISVNTDTNGNFYARTFILAHDIKTGVERTDVLRK